MSAPANAGFQNFDEDGERQKANLIERRGRFRECFVAAAEVTEPISGAVISARTDNLSAGGCFIDTATPFRTGTVVDLRLINGSVAFETQATVVSSQPKLGMGLAFDPAEEDQRCILETWLSEYDSERPAECFAPQSMEDAESPGVAEQQEREVEEEIGQDTDEGVRMVMNRLIITLLRKGLLTEDEAKTLLGPLFS